MGHMTMPSLPVAPPRLPAAVMASGRRAGQPVSELARLREERKAKHGKHLYSQAALIERIGLILGEDVSQGTFSLWERGGVDYRLVHPRRLLAYAKVLGITPEEFEVAVGLQPGDLFHDSPRVEEPAPVHTGGGSNFRSMPVVPVSRAGQPAYTPAADDEWPVFTKDERAATRVYRQEDASMDGKPGFPEGAIVLVDAYERRLQNGRVYLIVAEGQGLFRKYVETKLGAAFVAANRDLHPDIPAKDAQVLGHAYRYYTVEPLS